MLKFRIELSYKGAPSFGGIFEGEDKQQAVRKAIRSAYLSGWPSNPSKWKAFESHE